LILRCRAWLHEFGSPIRFLQVSPEQNRRDASPASCCHIPFGRLSGVCFLYRVGARSSETKCWEIDIPQPAFEEGAATSSSNLAITPSRNLQIPPQLLFLFFLTSSSSSISSCLQSHRRYQHSFAFEARPRACWPSSTVLS
jgi:hypothetical protein